MKFKQTLMGVTAKYVRVSTTIQNVERQKQNKGVIYFIDKVSGSIKFSERPQASRLIQEIKKGIINEVAINSVDRIGRNQIDILNTIEFLNSNNINLYIENLGLNSLIDNKPNPAFTLIVSVMSSVAQMERELLLERQKEGVAIAKAKKKYTGRKVGSAETKEKFISKHRDVVKLLNRKLTVREIVGITNKSSKTIQKVMNTLRKDELTSVLKN